MRLICPNCDAQYEVLDDVIPTEGRDVQCSNCGQTWFQHHPSNMPAEPENEDVEDMLEAEDDAPAADEERSPAPEPARRGLDPEVTDILREEAEIESQARAAEAETLESQPELGLSAAKSDAERRSREARERMARMRGKDLEAEQISEAAAAAAAIGSRRELLPDIEEINSTLRSSNDRQTSTTERADHTTTVAPVRKSGFRRGFGFMIVLAFVAGAVYFFAPNIAQAVPQVDALLNVYVTKVDSARSWLDIQVSSGLTWLDDLTASDPE